MYYVCVHAQSLRHIRFFATLWTVAHQASLSMGFYSQKYWGGLSCPPPGDLSDSGWNPQLMAPALGGGFFTTEPLGKPLNVL